MEGHRVRRQRSSTTKTKQPEPLERIQPNAAGIDCGSRHHHVAMCQGRTKTRPEWRRKIRPSGHPVACLKVAVRVG